MNRRWRPLPPAVRRAILEHAHQEAPRECCGFLIGSHGRVQFALRMTNIARSRTRYRIDSREHIRLRRLLREFVPALEIVGVYHSHPDGPATPSPRDCAEANYPEWLFAIADLSGRAARLGVFTIAAGKARRARLSRKV